MNIERLKRFAANGDADAKAALDRSDMRHGSLNSLDRLVDVVLAAIEHEDEDMLAPVYEELRLDEWQRSTLTWLLSVDDQSNWPIGELDEDSDGEEVEAAHQETRAGVTKMLAPWRRGEIFSQAAVDDLAQEFADAGWDALWREDGQEMPYWRLTSPGGGLVVSVWWDDHMGRDLAGWCWSQRPGDMDYDEFSEPLSDLDDLRDILS